MGAKLTIGRDVNDWPYLAFARAQQCRHMQAIAFTARKKADVLLLIRAFEAENASINVADFKRAKSPARPWGGSSAPLLVGKAKVR